MAMGPFSTSNRISLASALVSAAPLSMSCWAYPTSSATHEMFVCIGRTSANTHRFYLTLDQTNGKLIAGTADASYRAATSAAIMNLNAWNHCGGVWASAADRKVYLNGAAAVQDTNSATPTSLNASSIGIHPNATDDQAENSLVAEVGIWNVALTDAEMASLAKGFSPRFIRPQSLIAYLPLVRDLIDMKGNGWAIAGTVPVAPHCRIIEAA